MANKKPSLEYRHAQHLASGGKLTIEQFAERDKRRRKGRKSAERRIAEESSYIEEIERLADDGDSCAIAELEIYDAMYGDERDST